MNTTWIHFFLKFIILSVVQHTAINLLVSKLFVSLHPKHVIKPMCFQLLVCYEPNHVIRHVCVLIIMFWIQTCNKTTACSMIILYWVQVCVSEFEHVSEQMCFNHLINVKFVGGRFALVPLLNPNHLLQFTAISLHKEKVTKFIDFATSQMSILAATQL